MTKKAKGLDPEDFKTEHMQLLEYAFEEAVAGGALSAPAGQAALDAAPFVHEGFPLTEKASESERRRLMHFTAALICYDAASRHLVDGFLAADKPEPADGFGPRAVATLETWQKITFLARTAMLRAIRSDDKLRKSFESLLSDLERQMKDRLKDDD